jgi:hypothetical protein
MNVQVKDTLSGNLVAAEIKAAGLADMPLKKDGWNFNWRKLYSQKENTLFFKLTLANTPSIAEGMVMFTILDFGLLYMDCIEVSPRNYGSKGHYDHVAGCLLAYGCYISRQYGEEAYKGFLSFDSKTVLIELYVKKYGASHAGGQKLYFSDIAGNKLMATYLEGDK